MQHKMEKIVVGLKSVIATAFPKKCSVCGKTYTDLTQFIAETSSINHNSGLIAEYDQNSMPVVYLFRNCSCGSTLMDICEDRRDIYNNAKRREIFGNLLKIIIIKGVDEDHARSELINYLNGRPSTFIDQLTDILIGY
jgi:hypothetical protein